MDQTFIWNKANLMDITMFVEVEQKEAQDTIFNRPFVLVQSSILGGE
jgi:hypothetical protein